MQLFTLAAIFALAAFTFAAPTLERNGPCAQEKQRVGQEMPGKYVPKCTPHGYYETKQCHGSTGFCWCVDPESGKEIQGSRVAPGHGPVVCPPCHMKKAQSLIPGMIGGFVPQCDEYGLFTPTQFHGSTGQSWCVDLFTGEEFEGTRRLPGEERMECTGSQYCRKNETEGRPCCHQFFEGSSSIYRMQCTRSGFFKAEQVMPFSDKPLHFCVNPATGLQAEEAKAPNCGGCFKYLEEHLGGKQLLGSDMPRCLDHTGQFSYRQVSHDGFRWCVDIDTGKMLTEKRPLSDKTPLVCELMF